MATKERVVVKEIVMVLVLIAFLVLCSCLVNFRIVDLLYFCLVVSYTYHYITGK